MKYILILISLLAIAIPGKSQNSPKVYDPCQQLDTNQLKQLIIGTWVDVKDTSHVLIITDDSLTERIQIVTGAVKNLNVSYWSYSFTNNIFSTDAITCYSLHEYQQGYAYYTDYAINAINGNYLLLGATGKMVFKKKN